MFYLVAFQQKGTRSRTFIVGLVMVGKAQVMEVATPNASKHIPGIWTYFQRFHKEMPCHGPQENEIIKKLKDSVLEYSTLNSFLCKIIHIFRY